MHQFLISAAHKSSGKTTVSIGLGAALRERGLIVQTYKKGPDYIDPLWLARASGRQCRNLDFFISSHEEIRSTYARYAAGADVCLLEGNKGLYDGLALGGENSNAALAHLLDLPVILVLDARGMTRGVAPLILGYQAFDRNIRIAGIILNRLGGSRHESKLRAVIEHYTDVAVLGAVAEDASIGIDERHLGLMPANEADAALTRIRTIGDRLARQVDLERLLELTASSTPRPLMAPMQHASVDRTQIRIGIPQDAAFGFYYAEDIEALVAAGAQVVHFDTLQDVQLPPVDGLFIGGGFPENFSSELEANVTLREQIWRRIEAGMPVYAECGGLMYLANTLTWHGATRRMVGAIQGDIVMHDKPVGRGYVKLQATHEHPWPNDPAPPCEVRCHEFHYSNIENLPADTRFAYRVIRGHGVDGHNDGIVYKNVLASYSHLRATEEHNWPAHFVAFARSCKREAAIEAAQSRTA